MSVIGNLDVLVGADTSAFNTKMKEAAAAIRETFGLNGKQASQVAALELQLKKQVETWGMSTAEAKMYALSQQGVSGAALKTAHALQQEIYQLEEEKKALDAAKKAQDQLAAKGEALTQGVRSAHQKNADAVAEYRDMLNKGIISQSTFNKAVRDLPKPPSAILGFGKTLMGTMSLAGAAVTATAAGLAAYGQSALDAVDQTGDVANQIGISVESYTTLAHAIDMTGSSSADLAPALKKLNANLGDAAQKGGPAADALKRIGLDVQKTAAMKPDEAFRAIVGGFEGIKSPADQASLAMDLFGKGGISLINSLKAGGSEIDKFSGQAKTMGLALTNADTEMAGSAMDTLNNIWGMFGALGKKIAVGFAPYVTDLGTKFLDWASTSLDVSKIVNTALDLVSKGVGYVADTFNALKGIGQATYAALLAGSGYFLDGISKLGKGVESLINLFPGMEVHFTSAIDEMAKGLHILADEQWGKAKATFNNPPSNKIKTYFDEIKKSAEEAGKAINKSAQDAAKAGSGSGGLAEAFASLKEKLQTKIDLFGLGENAAEIEKFEKLGGTPQQIKDLQGLAAKLEGKSVIEKMMTPLEKARKEIQDLTELRNRGGLSQEQFDKARGKVLKDVGADKTKLAGALDVGSKEARSAILSFNAGGKNDSLKVQNEQVGLQRQMVTLLTNINGKTGKHETIKL